MLDKIQTKALEWLNRLDNAVSAERIQALRDEKGQTATEYVAMTAVGLVVSITVVWAILGAQLTQGINTMSNKLLNFIGT